MQVFTITTAAGKVLMFATDEKSARRQWDRSEREKIKKWPTLRKYEILSIKRVA